MNNTTVDFTIDNIYSIVIWSIKNANQYIDVQLLELYEDLTETKNVIGYKSNIHMIDDSWKYTSKWDFKTRIDRYKLDYRCVLSGWYGIHNSGYNFDGGGNLKTTGHEKISDIFTVAKNLGFDVEGDSRILQWVSGKPHTFYTKNGEIFAEIKAFQNGNLHYKLNQEFIKKFNVEAGKLKGWIKSPKEASEELDIDIKEATTYFNSSNKLLSSNVKLLV